MRPFLHVGVGSLGATRGLTLSNVDTDDIGPEFSEPYTLFTRIALKQDANGDLWTDRLWAQDLAAHAAYLKRFQLCCPVTREDPSLGDVSLAQIGPVKVYPLREDKGWLSVFANVLPNFFVVWRAVSDSEFVHSGGSEWAFPLSFYILVMRPFRAFTWIVVIESLFWRIRAGESASLRRKFAHLIHKPMISQSVRKADIRVFTHEGYRDFLLGSAGEEEAFINPAVWIEQDQIISIVEFERRLARVRAESRLRLIFPSRLIESKGVYLLKDAVARLRERRVPVSIVIMGAGELLEECQEMASSDDPNVCVSVEAPIPYGIEFLRKIEEFDSVMVLNLSDEQPRIIPDAYARGVPVIASNTAGNRSISSDKATFFFESGSAEALAQQIMALAQDRETVLRGAVAAREAALQFSHKKMHLDRARFIKSQVENKANPLTASATGANR